MSAACAPAGCLEGGNDFSADVEATRTDAGTECNPQILGPAAEPLGQRLHAGQRDARHGPAPTRVQRRARPGPWISDQDRHAVSHVHRQAKAAWLLHSPSASMPFTVSDRRRPPHAPHASRVFCETRTIARAPEAANRRRRFSATFSAESPHLLPRFEAVIGRRADPAGTRAEAVAKRCGNGGRLQQRNKNTVSDRKSLASMSTSPPG